MHIKTKARLAMGTFLTACLIPSLGMLFLPERPAAANQALAPPPSLTRKDGAPNPEALQEAADYMADHFAFRQELITADAKLNAALFRVSSEETVTLGRRNWLFYTETLDDHLHTNAFTEGQLQSAIRTLALMQEYIQDRGARLLFTIAPNKATLYPDFLPGLGAPLEGESNLERLVPLLRAEGIPYAGLVEAFRAEDEILYFHTDSHWNTRGAALAQQTLLTALDKEFLPFWQGEDAEWVPHRGDLYEMLYPAGTALEMDSVYARPFTFTYVRQPRGPDDQRIETENPSKTGRLLMFRDSFGNSLYPFMAEEFSSALFSRSMPCQLTLLDESEADTVVMELVERNLDYLILNAPIFPAPERERTGGEPAVGRGEAFAQRSGLWPLEGFSRLEGTLSGADAGSPVYVQLDSELYEATPAGEDWTAGAPFTLYVPESAPWEGASVLCLQNGTLCRIPLHIA